MRWKQNLALVLCLCSFAVAFAHTAAAQSVSPSYRVDEYQFGIGGELEACSTSYCSKQSAGDVTVGHTTDSGNNQAQGGFNTTDQPLLEVAVNGAVNFGTLTPSATASGTANVQVRTYLAKGYNLIITGTAPKYSTHALSAMATPASASAGTEQFGINLRANTTPSIGIDPVQVPDGSFSFGVPTADYNIVNSFKYQDGDTVASSASSSGQTNYTLSMIASIAANTPAGTYTTDLTAVAVSTF